MTDFHALAELIRRAMGTLPLVLTSRQVRSYDVAFSSVDVQVEKRLAAVDRAVLSLIAAQRRGAPEDVHAFLGLGADVSVLTTRRLTEEALLEDREVPTLTTRLSSLVGLRKRDGDFIPTAATPVEQVPPPHARRLVLTDRGTAALAADVRTSIETAPLRLVMWAEPLWFIEVPKGRAVGAVIEPAKIPDALRTVDRAVGQPAAERLTSVGLPASLAGLKGSLLGLSSGAHFEVRTAKSRADLLIGAIGPEDAAPAAFVGNRSYVDRAPSLDARLEQLSPSTAAKALLAAGCTIVAPRPDLTSAVLVNAAADEIGELLGSADVPAECWHRLPPNGAVRIRALPADDEAALQAFVLFASRRVLELGRDLEGTLAAVWTELTGFWGDPDRPRPYRLRVLNALWSEPATRGAMCQSRQRRDLIEAYLEAR